MARKGGNPDIARNVPKPGAKTDKGKLKSLIMCGNLKPTSKSPLLNRMSKCDKCTLRPRTEIRTLPGGKSYKETILASRCTDYKQGAKCPLPQGVFIDKLKFYYEVGEKLDSEAMNKAILYEALENMTLAKKTELMEDGKPSFMTLKFNELAASILHNREKIVHGEKHRVEADINSKVAVIDIGKLLKEKRESIDKFPWEKEEDGKEEEN